MVTGGRGVVQVHMEEGDRWGAIQACLHHGDEATGGDVRLWEETLRWLGSLDQDCSEEVPPAPAPAPAPALAVLRQGAPCAPPTRAAL